MSLIREKINSWKDKYVLIRSYGSGVHFGILVEHDFDTRHVLLKNSRRLWAWEKVFTMTEVSNEGIPEGKGTLSAVKDEMLIAQVEEVLPCTQEAIECLLAYPIFENK